MAEQDRTASPAFRLSVKAAVVRADRLLLVEYRCPGDAGHHSLPGGRPQVGEDLRCALARKVREETTLCVDVGDLLLVVEYVPQRHNGIYGQTHRVQLVFRCDPVDDRPAAMPASPEPGQYAVDWLPLAELDGVGLQPQIGPALRSALTGGTASVLLPAGVHEAAPPS